MVTMVGKTEEHVLLIYFALGLVSACYKCSAIEMFDGDIVDISLLNYDPRNASVQLFDANALLYPKSTILVNVNDVSYRDIEFFVIQVHSFKDNVALSNNVHFIKSSTVNGTNIGLVQLVVKKYNYYQFYIKNADKIINATLMYIIIVPYKSAPIPGGCNMEFDTEIAPYQRLNYTKAVITVDAQSASFGGHLCELQIVKHEIFHMYLPEIDFSSDTYFSGIKKMLTVTNITSYGTKVSRPTTGFLHQLYNAYKGTGSVYVIVASVNNSKSAYVPIVSYACDIRTSDCEGPSTTLSKILCSLLIFLGLFVCFFGHRFFRTEMFLVGVLVGGCVSYILFSLFEEISQLDSMLLSLGIGCLFGLTWVSFWHYYGIPFLSAILSLLALGYLFAAVVFYAGLSDLNIVHQDLTYWGFFTSIVVVSMFMLTSFMDKANILACGLVGSYAFIVPLDHYYGTNLKYIFINTIRRATVENFSYAVIDAPYQWRDLVLTVLWLGLAFSGVAYQWRLQIGRPPFPPTSQQLPPNERTPLIRPTSSRSPTDRVILIHPNAADA